MLQLPQPPASFSPQFISAVPPFSKHRGKSLPQNPRSRKAAAFSRQGLDTSFSPSPGGWIQLTIYSALHVISSQCSRSQSNGLVWVGRDLKGHVVQHLLPWTGTPLTSQMGIPPLMKPYCFAAPQHGWCLLLLPWLAARSITLLSPKQKCPSLL